MNDGINVLSLFDGISCGMIALERAGIKVGNYYASEINQHAMKVANKNYPNIIQLGDVTKITPQMLRKLPKIDLIIAGSPCQDLSAWKRNKNDVKGLEGKKSSLFYHFDWIVKYLKPRYFLLENVSMKKHWEDIVTEILEVEPMSINSNLVAAADRKRLYWTNIPNVTQPEDRGYILNDIAEQPENVPAKYWYDIPFIYNGDDKKVQCTIIAEKGFQDRMKEAYNLNGKCNTLLSDGDGGNRVKKIYQDGRVRKLMPIEYERLQTIPDNYTACISDSQRYSAVGNGWTVDVIAHIFKGLNEKNE